MVGGVGGTGGDTVNSRKLMGGVFKKVAAKSAAGNNNGFEFTVRDTTVSETAVLIYLFEKKRENLVSSLKKTQFCIYIALI